MKIKRIVSLVSLSILFILFSNPLQVTAKPYVIPENAYVGFEYSIFVDGKLIVLREKSYTIEKIKNPDMYVPLKLLGKLKDVNINYNIPITVSSDQGTFNIDSTNSVLFENSTYISLTNFQKFTGYKSKEDYDSKSVFLWSGSEGEKESKRLLQQLDMVSYDLQSFMGKKVYIYEGEKVGWVKELYNYESSSNIVKAVIQLNNGTIYEDLIFDNTPTSFIDYWDYETIGFYYTGKYYWANKNYLPSSNPLGHLEKVYFTSVKLKGKNLFIQAKRSNGAKQTFKLSFYDDYKSPIASGFYTVNPRTAYPGWSSNIWNKITQQKISIGMNTQQARLSWGEPERINTYNTSNLRIEQWVYGRTYLYFYNGKLESWTD
nr:hypothetical protein [Paenibacillus polysaccharolyticus]